MSQQQMQAMMMQQYSAYAAYGYPYYAGYQQGFGAQVLPCAVFSSW